MSSPNPNTPATTGTDNNQTKKAPPKNLVIPPKKPKLTKAERRAKQEAQRAAKGQSKDGQSSSSSKNNNNNNNAKVKGKVDQQSKKQQSSSGGVNSNVNYDNNNSKQNEVSPKILGLFSHLPMYKRPDILMGNVSFNSYHHAASSLSDMNLLHKFHHPKVTRLGYCYANGSIRGANARCRAMLDVFQSVIRDFCGKNNNFSVVQWSQELEHEIKMIFQFWTAHCRGHSVSMGNAMTFMKIIIANLSHNRSLKTDEEAKELLCDQIDAYVNERITLPIAAICQHAYHKIACSGKDNDDEEVILIYAKSEAIISILLHAKEKGKKFRVICVDSRPLMEGKETLEVLASAGIECTYILLNSLSYVMKEVTKVFLGAAALMSNGSVLSRVGTAGIALMAHSYKIPVLLCCETYKISARLQLESITHNELGDPSDVYIDNDNGEFDGGDDCTPNLTALNLLYDLTPANFVSGIITEMGILPPSSVAVLLREMNPQDNVSY